MCGFAGAWERAGWRRDPNAILRSMGDAIMHRGPDDFGIWTDVGAGIGFVFRRLAILDLSPGGHQPMASSDGRFQVVFNGEIYNFLSLREDLVSRGYSFRGTSDTEVMLAAFAEWGVQGATQRFVGMFAIALWDRKERELHLIRDRIGKKPLYYGWQGGTFLFGSELKALRQHPAFQGGVDQEALALYFRYGYIPGPYSIHPGISKLIPGSILRLREGAKDVEITPYWCPGKMAESGQRNPFQGSEGEALAVLGSLLDEAVRLRMVADVPLGAFLSGGIDSSFVVALMQRQSTRPVKTFTIGFNEQGYDEATHAKAVAQWLGTDHTEFYVTAEEARAVIPLLPQMYDEPFADSSQIPTFLVSRLARAQVTVAISGDGGDELFGGYDRYTKGRQISSMLWAIPKPIRPLLKKCLLGVSPAGWDSALGVFTPQRIKGRMGDRMHKAASLLESSGWEDVYERLVSQWDHSPLVNREGPDSRLRDIHSSVAIGGAVHNMMHLDLVSYLVDDILVKVDRASMAISLEARAPLLDHRVVEFAWSLPLSWKVKGRLGKVPLRRLLDRHVPRHLIDRPKMGFGVPIGEWLRGPLKAWGESLLDPTLIKSQGYLDAPAIERTWEEHQSGHRNWQSRLWTALMFQAWVQAR